MPQRAAEAALNSAGIPLYHPWTVDEARRFCEINGAKVIQDSALYKKLGYRLPAIARQEWDAKAVEFPNGRRMILFRDIGNKGRMIWNIIHELGHMKLGHEGAGFDLTTGILLPSSRSDEAEANRFAGHVLLQTQEMVEWFSQQRFPEEIAALKGVTVTAVRTRLKIMGQKGELVGWTGELPRRKPLPKYRMRR